MRASDTRSRRRSDGTRPIQWYGKRRPGPRAGGPAPEASLRRAGAAGLPLRADRGCHVQVRLQLEGQIKRSILSGRLDAGARSPSIQALASHSGVNRNTIARAFTELEREGYGRSAGRAARTWPSDPRAWKTLSVVGAWRGRYRWRRAKECRLRGWHTCCWPGWAHGQRTAATDVRLGS